MSSEPKSLMQTQLEELIKVGVGGKFKDREDYVSQVTKELEFEDGNVPFNIVMGSDGSSSQLRGAIVEKNRTKFIKKPLRVFYFNKNFN